MIDSYLWNIILYIQFHDCVTEFGRLSVLPMIHVWESMYAYKFHHIRIVSSSGQTLIIKQVAGR